MPPPKKPADLEENPYLPPGPEPLVFEDYTGGLNTNASRPGIAENEMAWCDGFFPLGKNNLRTLPGIGPPILAMNPATNLPYPTPPIPYPTPPPPILRGVIINDDPTINSITWSAPFSGIADSPVGTVSFWVRKLDNMGIAQAPNYFTDKPNSSFEIFTFNGGPQNQPDLYLSSPQDTQVNFWETEPPVGVQTANLWHHIMWAWDTNHADGGKLSKLTIDGATQAMTVTHTSNSGAFNIQWSQFGGFAVVEHGSGSFNAWSYAEMWLLPGVFIDPTLAPNLAKFLDGSGNPVDLGATGAGPTGSPPPLYFSLRSLIANDFVINRGNGGQPVLFGNLSLAATIPKANTP